ncbi:glycoside hydrolase family protein [Aeromonas veronii]
MQINQSFLDKIKLNEGCKKYQILKGIFRSGKFYPYKDHLGNYTIGYGHYLGNQYDNYRDGITEQDADELLEQDVNKALMQTKTWVDLSIHPQPIQELLVEMVFQLGIGSAKKFKRFKAAIDNKQYDLAAQHLTESLWFKQTPNRVNAHINVLNEA